MSSKAPNVWDLMLSSKWVLEILSIERKEENSTRCLVGGAIRLVLDKVDRRAEEEDQEEGHQIPIDHMIPEVWVIMTGDTTEVIRKMIEVHTKGMVQVLKTEDIPMVVIPTA